MPRTIIIIPARLESTRLPGKVLLDIAGKPMLEHVWNSAIRAGQDAVYIATDSSKIADFANNFGADVLLSGEHASGTDRIAAVIDQLTLDDDDWVINLQGDEPLMPPELLKRLAEFAAQQSSQACSMYSCSSNSVEAIKESCVKVVCDRSNNALYFSRLPIPAQSGELGWRLHHGVYAYRVSLLRSWPALQQGPLEQSEMLEQLRLLENGYSIAMQEAGENIPAGVDTPEDLQKVRSMLEQQSE